MVKRNKFIRNVFFLFFAVYVCIGFRIFSDYGVPIDEYSQMDLGRVNYERIVNGSQEIQQHFDRHYGPAFEIPLYVFSTFFGGHSPDAVMAYRHLGIFLLYAASLLFFYALLTKTCGNAVYGFLGVILLVAYPRFFAESFYNTKDMAFVAATIFVLFATAYADIRSWKSILLLSVVSAFAIAVRVQGLLLLLITASVLCIDSKNSIGRKVLGASLYIAATLLGTYGMFPLFWNDIGNNIVGFWRVSANSLGVATYFFGTFYTSPDLPWYYHFVWVGITAMASVLIGAIYGTCLFAIEFIRRRKKTDYTHRVFISMAGIIVGTFITSVYFHPRSYDGWRHIYYIYPCLVGLAVYGIHQAVTHRKNSCIRMLGTIVVIIMAVDVLFSLRFIIRNHPNQYLYFNLFAGGYSNARKNFDFDYWGISQKQLLAYVRSQRFQRPPAIYFQQILPYTERVMIPELEKKGMRIVTSAEEADLYVAINRDIKDPPPGSFHVLYVVNVEGAAASSIYASDTFLK